jgi:hypothetical protein
VKAPEDCSKGDEVRAGIEDPGRETGKVNAAGFKNRTMRLPLAKAGPIFSSQTSTRMLVPTNHLTSENQQGTAEIADECREVTRLSPPFFSREKERV